MQVAATHCSKAGRIRDVSDNTPAGRFRYGVRRENDGGSANQNLRQQTHFHLSYFMMMTVAAGALVRTASVDSAYPNTLKKARHL